MEVDPCGDVEDSPCPLLEDPDAQWQDDDVLLHSKCKSLKEPEALCLAHWQVVAFHVLQAQQEAVGWWATLTHNPQASPQGLHAFPHFH